MAGSAAHIVSKSEFARLSNVSAGRVSQWLSEGKIAGPAIVGEGPHARIDVGVARRQLQSSLDFGQRLGNGLATRLEAEDAAPAPDPIEARIKSERLRKLEMDNRAAAEAELARRGQFILAAEAAAALTRQAESMITVFEGFLPDFAAALAATRCETAREYLHLLRTEMRGLRARAAETAAAAAAAQPPVIATEALA